MNRHRLAGLLGNESAKLQVSLADSPLLLTSTYTCYVLLRGANVEAQEVLEVEFNVGHRIRTILLAREDA